MQRERYVDVEPIDDWIFNETQYIYVYAFYRPILRHWFTAGYFLPHVSLQPLYRSILLLYWFFYALYVS